MKTISVTADILCLILSFIVFYGTVFEMKHRSKQKTVFNLCVALTILTILSDLLTWVLEGKDALLPLNHFFTVITFIAPYLTIVVFFWYLTLYVEGKGIGDKHLDSRCFRVLLFYSAAATLLTVAGCCCGMLYSIGPEGYSDGAYYSPYLISMGISFLFILMFFSHYAKGLGLHDTLAVTSYMFFPVLGVVVNSICPDISISLPLSALSCVTIYIMLQSEQERKHMENELRLHKMVHIDELTGLMNRRAYTDAMDNLRADDPVGIIFCDVNGLKYTNDHQGHKAGDALLQELARILQEVFSQKDAYRISGDEFVVITEGLSEMQFYNGCKTLRERLEAYAYPLASMGGAYGVGKDGKLLMERAEENMRMDKEQFHLKHPLYKRV